MKSVILVPADFECESVRKFHELNRKYCDSNIAVTEFYGSLNPSRFGVTKNPKNLKRVNLKELALYCEELKKYGFEFNYILNFLCYGGKEFYTEGVKDVLEFIKSLYDIGIRRYTVANPVIAKAMGIKFPDIHISISVVQNTNTALKLRTYGEIPCVDRVYISEDIIRDFGNIRILHEEAKKHGIQLATLLNSFCLIECPYKVNHANVDGHLVDDCCHNMPHYFYAWCSLQKLSNPKEILRLQSIRPEDVSIYEQAGVTAFKIAGRELPDTDFLKTAEQYMKRRYDEDLMDLLVAYSDNFFKDIYTIDNRALDGRLEKMKAANAECRKHSNCDGCDICSEYISAISADEEMLSKYRSMFANSYDDYSRGVEALVMEEINEA